LVLNGQRQNIRHSFPGLQDQYDCIDFTNNAIARLEGFPILRRLKMLLLSNNRIYYVSPNIGQLIPNVEDLQLAGNQLTNLPDLDPLASLPKLQRLSLLDNTVTKRQHYRLYVIHKLPQVKILDFQKIRPKARYIFFASAWCAVV
jgi:U2 small nuclear ribonucleoprotein A'